MTGLPDHGKSEFSRCASKLREAGYTVLSPSEMDDPNKSMEWHEYLRRDIRWLCDCDGIALIPNWADSKGAHLELMVALRLGMFVICAETLQPLDFSHDYEFNFSGQTVQAI